jgi:hypothetical protein
MVITAIVAAVPVITPVITTAAVIPTGIAVTPIAPGDIAIVITTSFVVVTIFFGQSRGQFLYLVIRVPVPIEFLAIKPAGWSTVIKVIIHEIIICIADDNIDPQTGVI